MFTTFMGTRAGAAESSDQGSPEAPSPPESLGKKEAKWLESVTGVIYIALN